MKSIDKLQKKGVEGFVSVERKEGRKEGRKEADEKLHNQKLYDEPHITDADNMVGR